MTAPIMVTKASGERVPFSPEKLTLSLLKAGANDAIARDILAIVLGSLSDGTTTKKIYQQAFNLLKMTSDSLAGKYKLKQGIMELGPSGYPFEKFVGEIMKYQGFDIKVGEIVEGKCVKHEVDVIARKESLIYLMECKFHGNPGTKSDVKIPLYINSRFEDIKKAWKRLPDIQNLDFEGWLVTNTHFTTDAIQYGNCVGLNLLGWSYPLKGSLKELIDKSGLYPITIMSTLHRKELKSLLKNLVVLCREIVVNPGVLREANIDPSRLDEIVREAKEICNK